MGDLEATILEVVCYYSAILLGEYFCEFEVKAFLPELIKGL